MTPAKEKEWWHVFGRMVDTKEFGPCVSTLTVHPGKHPRDVETEVKTEGFGTYPYLGSYDHEPTEAERAELRRTIEAAQ